MKSPNLAAAQRENADVTEAFLADIARRCTAEPASPLPKYLRLMNAVEDAMADGVLGAGERLPTEIDLAGAVPYSLGTVQKALNGLVSRGLLRRSRRSGTFVAERVAPLDDMSRFAFERPDGTIVDEVNARVTGCATVQDPGRAATILPASASGYVRIVRIDEIDRTFACCSEIHVSGDRFPEIASAAPEALSGRNLRPLLDRRYGAATARLDVATHAAPMPGRVATLLGLAAGTVGMELEITGRTASGEAVFAQTLFVPPTAYRVRFAER